MAPIPKPAPALKAAPPEAAPASSVPFPTAALGPLLSAGILAAAARTQAPVELVAHHILTLAAMAAQRLISVRLPTGAQRPVSCFFASLVGTGEGRAAAEALVVGTARLWERAFEQEFPMRVAAHIERGADSGVARPQPLKHLNLFYEARGPEATNRYRTYLRQAGLFTRHPHDLLQPGRPRREEAATLCALWNGKVVKQSGGPTHFPRLSAHLVATPRTARAFLSEPELAEAGLLGRLLVTAPASRIGTRTFTLANSDEPPHAFAVLLGYLGELYEDHPTAHARVVGFSNGAAASWLSYAREVEAAMAPGAPFAAIRDFAGHLPEHAARLAAVIALMEDCGLEEITEAHLAGGLMLARYYTAERLSLQSAAAPKLSETEKEDLLREWLQRTHAEKDVTLRDICRTGPRGTRDVNTAYKLMRRLERLGIVRPANDAFPGAGTPHRIGGRYAWKVEKEAGPGVA